jgi:hypothetical protein
MAKCSTKSNFSKKNRVFLCIFTSFFNNDIISCIKGLGKQTVLRNTEASYTNVSEETLFSWQRESDCRLPARHKESLEGDEPSKAPSVKPSPNPDNSGPIVRRPMGVPIMAICNTAWDRTRVCSDAVPYTAAPLGRPEQSVFETWKCSIVCVRQSINSLHCWWLYNRLGAINHNIVNGDQTRQVQGCAMYH